MTPFIKAEKSTDQNPNPSMYAMHTHDTYEIFCFLSGNAKYFVEGNVYPLKSGDILIMKKAEAHSLLIKTSQMYERIVISFSGDAIDDSLKDNLTSFLDNRPLGVNNRYAASVFKEKNWLYYLNKICETEDLNIQSLYLNVLLSELCESSNEISDNTAARDDIMEILSYINRHLSDFLTLEKICNRFYISKSQINKKFKKVIGTTVWEYITAKRLLLAKDLLQKGNSPTSIYPKCGFRDYCTFFRAYKAKFAVSPKRDYNGYRKSK